MRIRSESILPVSYVKAVRISAFEPGGGGLNGFHGGSVCVCLSRQLIYHPGIRDSPSVSDNTHGRNKHTHLLDPCREAHNGEKQSVCVEVFEHALDGLSVDPERDAGSSEVQTAAHHVLRGQDVLVQGCNGPRDTTCWTHAHTDHAFL